MQPKLRPNYRDDLLVVEWSRGATANVRPTFPVRCSQPSFVLFAPNEASKYFGFLFILLATRQSPTAFVCSSTGWVISTTPIYFPDIGDSVSDDSTIFVGVHKGYAAATKSINISFPSLTGFRVSTC